MHTNGSTDPSAINFNNSRSPPHQMKIYVHNKQLNTHKLLSTPWKTKTYSTNTNTQSISFVRMCNGFISRPESMTARIENDNEKDSHIQNKCKMFIGICTAVCIRFGFCVHSTSAAYLFDRDTYATKKNEI